MPRHQPELGERKVSRVRYRITTGPCVGVYANDDLAHIPDNSLAKGINVRVDDGIVLCRGGQSKRNPDGAMDGAVYGLIDTEGEFDGSMAGLATLYGLITNEGSIATPILSVTLVLDTTNPAVAPYIRSIALPNIATTVIPSSENYTFHNVAPGSYFLSILALNDDPPAYHFYGAVGVTLLADTTTNLDITLSPI